MRMEEREGWDAIGELIIFVCLYRKNVRALVFWTEFALAEIWLWPSFDLSRPRGHVCRPSGFPLPRPKEPLPRFLAAVAGFVDL